MRAAERVARAFHETYERLAPGFGYETRQASAKPWEDVPGENRALMIATVATLMADGVIEVPPLPPTPRGPRLAARCPRCHYGTAALRDVGATCPTPQCRGVLEAHS